ncbi:MAG: hybrid sensor histidine kinase/response regulator [Rhizobiales bacterium]|nr:hybrid sensor histidine kinase/response regulator [Hyphomicrobiales bacterium]
MSTHKIDDVDRLQRINEALIHRVERAMDQQHNAFSLFQTAISLEGQVRQRTDELSTTLRRLEVSNIELARQKEISERANLSKTRFLAAASHDVLQPLHAAQLVVSTLADIQDSEQGKRLIGQVERSLDTMHELLQTLLDISRLDAGVVVPSFESVSLRSVVASLLSDFRPIAEEKGIELRSRTQDLAVWSDRRMLRRVLQNLVSNSIRYTSEGSVLIATRKRGEKVVIEVIDTGIGIPADQEEHIFEEFHRGAVAKGSEESMNAGLGLGLAIVKRLVSAMKHSLTLSTREGHGTRMSLTAPLAARREEVEHPKAINRLIQASSQLSGARVLLIENEPTVSEAMSGLLVSWGCSPRTSGTKSQALRQLEGWSPDLIIADQHLDYGDLGTDTIREVCTRSGRKIPAIVITADPADAVLKSSEDVGAELMHKPIKPAQLRALMHHMLANQESSASAGA